MKNWRYPRVNSTCTMNGLDKLVGLQKEKQKARIAIASCLQRGVVFPHTLLYGIGGTGKTVLAHAIAEELQYHVIETEAAAFKTRNHILSRLKAGVEEAQRKGTRLLLFVDEIHRLSIDRQEAFYIPMKEWRAATAEGQITLAPFCLVGATTRRDMLDEASFVSRFPNQWQIQRYTIPDIMIILSELFEGFGMGCESNVLRSIAKRCLGIPRHANNLAGKVRDVVLFNGGQRVRSEDVQMACSMEGIDKIGLNQCHLAYLNILHKAGGPRGLTGLAAKLMQPVDVISGTIEPILLSLDFIDLAARGRVLTASGAEHVRAA